jgi:hypothetical protein
MLIEAVLRKKIGPIVVQTAGSTEANSVCISEGSFQNMLNYNKQNSRRHTVGKRPGDLKSEDVASSSFCGKSLTSECHSQMQMLRLLMVIAKWKKGNVFSNDRTRSIESCHLQALG